MNYQRMVMEVEAPEQIEYDQIRHILAERSMSGRVLGDLGLDLARLVLRYDDHRGHPALREAIAAAGNGALNADDALICAGAAEALFTVAPALPRAGDHMIVAHSNYSSNFETPRAIGADIDYLQLQFDDGWAVDPDRVTAMIRPETRLAAGVVCFPRIVAGAGVDLTRFHHLLNHRYGVFAGPGHCFEQENRYLRIGHGYPTQEELNTGLRHLSRALCEATGKP